MAAEIVVSQRGHEAEISEYLSRLLPGGAIILDMGGMLPLHIRKKHPSIAAGACFSHDNALAIDRMAIDLAQTWYGGNAGPKYKGISVGDLIANMAMLWFISAIKHSSIIAHLCSEVNPEALVIVDDKSPLARILTSIAEAHDLPVRRIPHHSTANSSSPRARGLLRRRVATGAQVAYGWFHSARNILTHLGSTIQPGFQRPSGLRSILFDPYIGYEWLVPELFGAGCKHIVVPCPNVRQMPRIRYYQDIFGVPTIYFHTRYTPQRANDLSEFAGLLETFTVRFEDQERPPEVHDFDIAWPSLRNAFQDYCAPLIQKARTEIDAAELIIQKHSIDATVLPWDELGLYKALTLVGRRHGLLTVRYQHGVAIRYAALIPPSSEKIVVWDEDAWTFFRSLGVADNRLTIIPNPMVKVLNSKARRTDKILLRRKLGIEETRHVVLFAAMPYVGQSTLDHQEEVARILADIVDVAHRVRQSHFIIKLHPNNANHEELLRVQNLVHERRLDNVTVLISGDTHELIVASDVVVAEASTCLWEAKVLNRPAVGYIKREFIKQVSPFGPNSGVIRTDSPEALAKALNEIIVQKGTATGVSPLLAIKIEDISIEQSDYYNDPRWELLSLIPSKTRRLLDVGCGAGWLGQKVKATRPCFVVGIEGNPDAAKVARKVLDEVFVADIEQFSIPFHDQSFDCIVFGDILEHLRDPWKVLKQYVELLGDDGVAVISIPNVRHYTTLLSLFRGHWEYKAEGILDRTHMRFFTYSGVKDLLEQAGLRPIRILRNTQSGCLMRIVNIILGSRLADLITFQYLAVAKRRAKESNL